jgi:probable F420-dependent oxidoreductase
LGDRFLLGIGISHAPLIGEDYRSPVAVLTKYLDDLDAAGHPADRRIVAALGPKMLKLARDRSAGTHPYWVPVEHTPVARAAMGPGKLVAPEVTVVLESDPVAARALARQFMAIYLGLPNYTNNVLRFGFTTDDLANGGSDRLVDAIVAWGDEAAIADRIRQHHAAGADHVCIQVLGSAQDRLPMDALRRLAPALLS